MQNYLQKYLRFYHARDFDLERFATFFAFGLDFDAERLGLDFDAERLGLDFDAERLGLDFDAERFATFFAVGLDLDAERLDLDLDAERFATFFPAPVAEPNDAPIGAPDAPLAGHSSAQYANSGVAALTNPLLGM
jgi:hypothetical protein